MSQKKTNLTNWILPGVLVFVVLLELVPFHNNEPDSPPPFPTQEQELNALLYDSMPYARYKVISDSFKLINDCNRITLLGGGTASWTDFIGYARLPEIPVCDGSFSLAMDPPTTTFLILPGYYMRPRTHVLIKDRKYWLQTYHATAVDTAAYTIKEIGVRYQPFLRDPNTWTEPQPGSIAIPVSATSYKVIKTCTWFIIIALALFACFIIIVLPVKVLYAISRNQMFYPATVKRLAIIGWGLIGLALLPGTGAFLLYCRYANTIPDELYLRLPETFLWNHTTLVAGLTVLLVRRAFKQGASMQEDLDLTY